MNSKCVPQNAKVFYAPPPQKVMPKFYTPESFLDSQKVFRKKDQTFRHQFSSLLFCKYFVV